MGCHWNSTKNSIRILLKYHSNSSGKNFLMESQHCSNSPGTEEFDSLWNPSEMSAVFRQNSGHPAVFNSGETGGTAVEFHKNISGISDRFQKDFKKISNSSQNLPEYCSNSTEKLGQISRRNSSRIPMAFRRNSTGTPPEYHWNSAGQKSKETSKIPADFRQKSYWKSIGIPVVFQRNSRHLGGLAIGKTREIPVEFQQKIHRKSTGIPLKFHRKIRPNFPAESKWNSGGTVLEYQWYSGTGIPRITVLSFSWDYGMKG